MPKSWGRLLANELLLWGKSGAGVARDFAETGVTELGRFSGVSDKKFKIETKIAFYELAKEVAKQQKRGK